MLWVLGFLKGNIEFSAYVLLVSFKVHQRSIQTTA